MLLTNGVLQALLSNHSPKPYVDACLQASHIRLLFLGEIMLSSNDDKVFDPMQGVVAEGSKGGLPIGNYIGVFVGAEYLPAKEPDPMSGEGGRQWPKTVFRWQIVEGEYKDKFAIRETSVGQGTSKSAFVQVCGLVMGKTLTAKDPYNLKPYVGRKYGLTIGNKTDKNGNATQWTHVVNAMLMSYPHNLEAG